MNFEKEFNTNFNDEQSNATKTCCKWISLRCQIACLSLLGCVVLVTTRSNLNLAIVSMTTQSADENFTISNDSCHSFNKRYFIENLIQYETDENNQPEFNWSQTTQGIILGVYYIGYICFQTIGSRAAELFGAKWICGFGILLSGLINLLTPLIVRFHFYCFIASRILLGLAQSAIFSSFYALFVRWFPDDERPKFLSWLDTGNCIGGILVMIVSGYLIRINLFGGWPSAFYVPGISALIWFTIWSLYVHSDPRQSRWISKDELNYIIENQTNQNASKQRSICWSKIVKSKQFYSVLIAKFLISFTFEMLFAKLPTYLNNVINIPIEQNGLINSMTSAGASVSFFFGGIISMFVLQKTKINRTHLRKSFEGVSGFSMSICLITIPFVGCQKIVVIVLLILVEMSNGLVSGGDIPIVAEMTAEFAATIFSIMNTVSSCAGLVSPLIVGLIIEPDPFSLTLWSYVFYLAAFLSSLGTLTFIAFASAQPQNWGK